ncbi:hypothetical protein JTB14_012321 [Gonioctena quinquepunctata]|nr:hypothetical protein JTB14_012321 [Gonioctena quinquepunctata]
MKLVQEKPLLELQNSEYNEKLAVLRTEVVELKDSFAVQERQLKGADEERQEVVRTNRKIKEEAKNKIGANKTILGDIKKLLNSIESYETNEKDKKLDKSVEELAELKINEAKLEEAKNKIVEAISGKKEALAMKDKIRIEIDLCHRGLEKEHRRIQLPQIRRKEEEIEEIDRKRREISSMIGQREEIEQQVAELEKDLAKPENKNAYNNYKKQFFELNVNKVVLEELNKYVIVLEKSVLKFHEERLVHINRTIRELWRSMYRGNDIDYIEIKTENTGGGKRRTYNYKVVQVKNNVELEMRGRCSAGQKVLACLVIQMALAETFSTKCGILALDEPTTNLDRENILSLSDALSRIITDREKEKSFQLLIITHDEEFLHSLSRVQSLDSYLKVTRNQGGFSKVDAEPL